MRQSKIHILCFLLFACFSSWAQQLPLNLRHSGELFLIEQGTDVKIKGGLESTHSNQSNNILNLGNIYISDTVANYGGAYIFGTLPDTLGKVYLDGTKPQKFSGKAVYFSNLILNNSADTLFVHNDTVYITKKVNFAKGKIDVGDGVLHLKRTSYTWGVIEGELDDEDSSSYVFGYPGYIKMYRPLALGNTYTDMHNTGISLKVNGNLGTRTELRRYHQEQGGPTNGFIKRQYGIHSVNSDYITDIALEYQDTLDFNGNQENKLAVFNSIDGGVTWNKEQSTIDTNANKVSSAASVMVGSNSLLSLAEGECDSLPPVQFTQDTFFICSGKSVYLTISGVDSSDLFWSTGVSNVDSIQVNQPAKYWVTVKNEFGCSNTDTCQVAIAPDPVPGFFAAPHCVGDSAFFNDTSKISSGTLSYTWDFGDPFSKEDTSSQKAPKYLFTKFGTFNAKVNLVSDKGCEQSISRSVVVLPAPRVRFTVGDTCADSAVTFTNNTQITGTAGITYKWHFGDGDTSIVNTPNHSYSTDTTYQVRLVATSQGCSDSVDKTVTIHHNPKPKFVFDNSCINGLVQFTDSTDYKGGTPTYLYDFGNGKTSAQQNPNTTYSSTGNYTVGMQVTSDKGCMAEIKDTINVHPYPNASFSFANQCHRDSLLLTNNSTVTGGGFSSKWFFGDGDTSISDNPLHQYVNTGQYQITLVVTSDSGCVDSSKQNVDIHPMGKSGFTVSKACEGDQVNFTNTSVVNAGTLSYKWYFANGDTSIVKDPNTVYPTSGNYSVLLVSSTSRGCSDSLTQNVVVQAKPTLALGSTIATCGKTLEIDAGNAGSTFLWNNGKLTQKITVQNSGNYWVNVTNTNGCSKRDTVTVQLNTDVRPVLGPDRTVCDSVVLNTGYGSTTSNALWSTSATAHSITVTNTGTYWARVTDPNNCIGTDTVTITVNNSPNLNLGPDISACEDSVLSITSNVTVPTYNWSSGETVAQISPNKSGTYTLTVTDANGCSAQDDIVVTLYDIPDFSLGADTVVCDSLNLNVNVSGASYLWKNGTSNNHYKVSNTEQTWVTATLGNGCSSTDSVLVTVNVSPIVNLGNDTILCFGESIVLKSNVQAASYKWSDLSTADSLRVITTKDISLSATGQNGCTGTDSIRITVNPLLDIELGNDRPICDSQEVDFNLSVAKAQYTWGGANSFTSSSNTVSIGDSGTYWVNVIDSVGCQASDTIRLLYNSKQANADFLMVNEIFTGDTVAFINLSYPIPERQLWATHDGATATTQHFEYSYFQKGEFDVKLIVFNSVCTDTVTKKINVKLRTRQEIYETADLATLNYVQSLNVYPNPTSDVLNVEFDLLREGDAILELYNMQGNLLNVQKLNGEEFLEQIELNNQSAGMYFIRVATGRSSRIAKFIKVN